MATKTNTTNTKGAKASATKATKATAEKVTAEKVTLKGLREDKRNAVNDVVAKYNNNENMLSIDELENGDNIGEKVVMLVGTDILGVPQHINSKLISAFGHDVHYDYMVYNGSTPHYMDFTIVIEPRENIDGEMWENHIYKPLAVELANENATLALRADDHETVAQVFAFMRYNAFIDMVSEVGVIVSDYDAKIDAIKADKKAKKVTTKAGAKGAKATKNATKENSN